jgi:hypothetical protein
VKFKTTIRFSRETLDQLAYLQKTWDEDRTEVIARTIERAYWQQSIEKVVAKEVRKLKKVK